MEIRRRLAHASSWLLACCVLLLTTKCSKEDGPDLSAPQMAIGVAKNITRTSAEISGTISGGNLKAYEVGFMYSTAKSDLTTSVNSSASKVSVTATSGNVTALLSKLQPNTVYYYCLYARSGKTQLLSDVGQFTTTALGKPELGSISIVSVDEYSFTLSCTVVADGGSNLQSMGFEYKLSHETAWLKSILTAAFDEGSTNKFTVTIPDLEPETAYRVRAIATNKEGTAYSSEEGIEVVTKELSAPVVSTQNIAADNIGSDWVTVIGSITNKGGSDEITRRGFVYSTSKENPLADVDETILSDVEKDQFHATIKGLKPNTTYYLRAFASNVVDNQPKDGYGNTITFTTLQYTEPTFTDVKVDSQTETSAVISFMLQQGSGSIIQTGICYSATNASPDMEDKVAEAQEESNRYVVSLTDLQSDRNYYAHPYVVCIGSNGKETTLYGEVLSFKTSAHALPKIVNFMVGNVNQTSAKLMATFEKGTVTIVEKGFCYINNLVTNPTIDNKKVSVDGADFEAILSDLTPETNYACRAYISYQYEGNIGVAYSETETFTTSAYAAAKVSLPELTDISYTSAKATAVITSLGDGTLKEKGFCWKSGSAMPSLDDANSKHVAVSSDDFSATITDLKSDNSYYIRAYVVTEIDGKEMIAYSDNNSFTTLQHTLPSFVAIAVDNISQTSATLSATFDKGSVTITEKGFCYNTSGSTPTIANKKVTVDGDNLTATLSDLTPETDYACRAYISYQYEGNSGVVYSDTQTFTTGAYAAAEVTSPELTDISYTSVKATAEITSLGDGTLKEKGFCWKSGYYTPSLTDADSKHVAVEGDDFSATITDLKAGSYYYIRAYVITEVNGKEVVTYSSNSSFSTLSQYLPEVAKVTAEAIETTSIQLKAYCYSKGTPQATEYGFVWSTTKGEAPAAMANKQTVTLDDDNYLRLTLTGLASSTNYYIYAYAINAAGTVYSSEALEVSTKGGPNIDDNPSPGIN